MNIEPRPMRSPRTSLPRVMTPRGNDQQQHEPQYDKVVFCQGAPSGDDNDFLQHHRQSGARVLIERNRTASLRRHQVAIKNVIGCCHMQHESGFRLRALADENGSDTFGGVCLFCEPRLDDLHPMLVTGRLDMLEDERRVIREFIVDHRGVVRDASIWMAARIDWELTICTHRFLTENYPVICTAFDDVNRLPQPDLDGRCLAAWYESEFSEEAARPKYCSWLFVPQVEDLSDLNVFYVPTRLPLDMDIVAYLCTVLRPPEALIKTVAEHSKHPNYLKRYLEHLEKKRGRPGAFSKLNSPRHYDVEHIALGGDTADVRDERAERLESLPADLVQRMDAHRYRLQIVTTDPRIRAIEARNDYIFTRHEHYVNILYVALPPDESHDSSVDDDDTSSGSDLSTSFGISESLNI